MILAVLCAVLLLSVSLAMEGTIGENIPDLLIIKAVAIPNGCVKVYHLESERLNTIILTCESEADNGLVEFHAYPADNQAYTVTSRGPSLVEAVKPVILTIERLSGE